MRDVECPLHSLPKSMTFFWLFHFDRSDAIFQCSFKVKGRVRIHKEWTSDRNRHTGRQTERVGEGGGVAETEAEKDRGRGTDRWLGWVGGGDGETGGGGGGWSKEGSWMGGKEENKHCRPVEHSGDCTLEPSIPFKAAAGLSRAVFAFKLSCFTQISTCQFVLPQPLRQLRTVHSKDVNLNRTCRSEYIQQYSELIKVVTFGSG